MDYLMSFDHTKESVSGVILQSGLEMTEKGSIRNLQKSESLLFTENVSKETTVEVFYHSAKYHVQEN